MDALPQIQIVSITIDKGDGKVRPRAKLALAFPELLESWTLQQVFVRCHYSYYHSTYSIFKYIFTTPNRNKDASVMVGLSISWLCVTRLPQSMTETQFYGFVSMYGPVDTCFLMASSITGQSKGYGLVRYQSMEAATRARHLINLFHGLSPFWSVYTYVTYTCDWIPDFHETYRSLHSKCLFVDNLPPYYRNLTMFRKIFSVIKQPIFCQVNLVYQ